MGLPLHRLVEYHLKAQLLVPNPEPNPPGASYHTWLYPDPTAAAGGPVQLRAERFSSFGTWGFCSGF